ncbi:MAG: hypothetical protein LBK60_02965 [Verrucomicrobiales bacterium]|jgi:hypothetical protein|nr:hypothetical protein [Verrucomicrobiales bacterium]
MKTSWLTVLLLSTALLARAMDFTTDDGRVLKDARLLKVSKGQAYVVHADGVAALPLTPKVTTDFHLTADHDEQELPSLVKLDLENWLMEVKTTNLTYRRPKSTAPRVSTKTERVVKPVHYQAVQFAKQYTPGEDEGRRVTLTGWVSEIIGRKETFKIIIDDVVVLNYKTNEKVKVMNSSGDARAIGPYKAGEDITVIGSSAGRDADGRIIFNGGPE